MSKNRKKNKKIILFVCFVFFIASGFLSIVQGAVYISLKQIFHLLLYEREGTLHQILWNVRIARTVVAGLVGMCLAVSGVILQGIMGNPLASPNLIGVSSGGGFMACMIMVFFPEQHYLIPAGAFIGALTTTLVIYFLAWRQGIEPTRLILAGIAVSSFLNAGIHACTVFYPEKMIGAIGFTVGGLAARSWPDFWMIAPYGFLSILITLLLPQKLNILSLGDEVAIGLGMNVEKIRFLFIVLSSFLAASAVSVAGLLGFVGLLVPHISRIFFGSDYRYVLPSCILLGGGIVMLCDTMARCLFSPIEIPVGIIMALLGSPFFLYLLRQQRKG